MSGPEFTVEIFQNEHLPAGIGEVNAVDIVPEPEGLAADFKAMRRASMDKEVADVALRIWMPRQATVRFVRQVAPAIDDLTARRTQASPEASPQAGDYPTGAWGAESRDYHVCVSLEPGAIGQEILAARISRHVAHDTGQADRS
jgi:hypothetical protein